MDPFKAIRWYLRIPVLTGACFLAVGVGLAWHKDSGAPTGVGVASYIGVILAAFTGLLTIPLGRLSQEFPDRIFWRTILQPLPLICFGGLIVEGALCYSVALDPSAAIWFFFGATSFLVALVGYILMISKFSSALAMYGGFAKRIVRSETCSLLRTGYVRYLAAMAPDRLLGPPYAIVRILLVRLPSLLREYRKRKVPRGVLVSTLQSLAVGCVLAVRDAIMKRRRPSSPPLICQLQLNPHGFRLVQIDGPSKLPSFNVCGKRTRQIIEDIGSVGRRGIRQQDLDLVTTSYTLLGDLGDVGADVRGGYNLEQDEFLSALREQFSLAVDQAISCQDNRILPEITKSASLLANRIAAHADPPPHSGIILAVVGFTAVFRAVTISQAIQHDESVACSVAINALRDLGITLVHKQYRLSAYQIIDALKDTAQSYMVLTKTALYRNYPDVLAGDALSGILRIWAADMANWNTWNDCSLSLKAAEAAEELGTFYLTQREDSLETAALGELTQYGNLRYLQPTGSQFHPSSALSEACTDQDQDTDSLLLRLAYASSEVSSFLCRLLECAATNRKSFVAGQLASEVADIVLVYLSVLRQLKQAAEPKMDNFSTSRCLGDAIRGVSDFCTLACWRLADAFVAFLDCSPIGVTDFGNQLLRATWACIFVGNCEPNFNLDAAVKNIGHVLTAKGQDVIRSRDGASVIRLLAFWYTKKLKPDGEDGNDFLGLAKESVRSSGDAIPYRDFYPTNMLMRGVWTPRMPACKSPHQELAGGIKALLDPEELQDFQAEVLKVHQ